VGKASSVDGESGSKSGKPDELEGDRTVGELGTSGKGSRDEGAATNPGGSGPPI
jgi:hypothetical protein